MTDQAMSAKMHLCGLLNIYKYIVGKKHDHNLNCLRFDNGISTDHNLVFLVVVRWLVYIWL